MGDDGDRRVLGTEKTGVEDMWMINTNPPKPTPPAGEMAHTAEGPGQRTDAGLIPAPCFQGEESITTVNSCSGGRGCGGSRRNPHASFWIYGGPATGASRQGCGWFYETSTFTFLKNTAHMMELEGIMLSKVCLSEKDSII